MSYNNFVAIDFELMTAERTSACAIGLVKVEDGIVTQKFYSLINPIPDNRDQDNSIITGITREMVKNAPGFDELFMSIRAFVADLPLAAHNASVDMDILERNMDYYGLSGIDTANCICTYECTGLSLTDCCEKYHINIGTHHDALNDANACASILLALNGKIFADVMLTHFSRQRFAGKRKYDYSTLVKLDENEIENKDTPFFNAKVVITGIFDAYPDRNTLGRQLQALGADMNTSISSKTNIVVIGKGAGPSKIKKIEDLRSKGCVIRVIYEDELVKMLK